MPLVQKWALGAGIAFVSVLSMFSQPLLALTSPPIIEAKPGAATSDFAKATELTMPVKDGGFKLGEVIVLVGTDQSLRVQKASLLTAIRGAFRAEALKELDGKIPGADYVDLADITQAGLKTSYNPADLEISIEPTVEQRPRGEVTGSITSSRSPADLRAPADFTGFMNVHFGAAYSADEKAYSEQFEFPALSLDGAVRWQGLVLEGDGQVSIDGAVTRRSTRLIYDFPEEAIRVSAGDLLLHPGPFFVTPPLLGVAIELSYADLQPMRNVRPTGKRSFRVERPSEVSVLINNSEVRRLRLAPGEYDLDDLPLGAGNNDIRLVIKDEFGNEENVDFTILFNRTLLEPGLSEWSVAAGRTATVGLFEPDYEDGEPAISASLRAGLSETLTASFGVQATKRATLNSAGALTQTDLGLLSLDAATSLGVEIGFGWSVAAGLDLETDRIWERLGTIRLGAEFQSKGFTSSLDEVSDRPARIRLNGSLSQPLPARFSMGVSGYYLFSQSEADQGFGTSLSLSRLVSPELMLGLSGGYEYSGRDRQEESELEGFSMLARLNFRPSSSTNLALEYDGIARSATMSIGTEYQQGASQASIDVDLERLPRNGSDPIEHALETDVSYANSRVEVNASHSRQFERLGTTQLSSRTSANIGTGVAFADGKVAVGRPIRGAFAIVDTHPNLAASGVHVDPFQESYRASSDGLGPLVVSDITAYVPTDLAYDVDDLPVGYDLGSGAFNLFAAYKSGFALSIGSDSPVTAMGVLLDNDHKPVAFKAGFASSPVQQDKRILLFTNAAGKFSAQGLNAGDWTIEMNHDPRIRYALKIPTEATGFVDLGDLQPEGGVK
ncbi:MULTISPECIES: fimbria/pilus outer membrane usher protein [Rhodomicrobium]|uniref:fimbria/pilus outer membrane usher protein n=1 Tax=Rhodomicrobium TaxID=1068 RepID=UPI000F7408E1|nr:MULTISPECIES: fimbria/pilus outer membrane usher protein [Rhodomicrobium]